MIEDYDIDRSEAITTNQFHKGVNPVNQVDPNSEFFLSEKDRFQTNYADYEKKRR